MLSLDDSFGLIDLSWFDSDPAPGTPPPHPEPPLCSATPSPPPEQPLCSAEAQRRLRRKLSNRESARRCRIRKQRHLEDLRAESARLRSENRDLAARIGAAAHRCLLLRRANGRLRAESADLRRRLAELRQLVVLRKLLMTAGPAAAAAAVAAAGRFLQ